MKLSNITNKQIKNFLHQNGIKQDFYFVRNYDNSAIMCCKDTDDGCFAVFTIKADRIKTNFHFNSFSDIDLNKAWKSFILKNNIIDKSIEL